MVADVMSAGLTGIRSGMRGMAENAAEIASARQQEGRGRDWDIAAPLVEQVTNVRQVEASAKVLKTENETVGRFVDMLV